MSLIYQAAEILIQGLGIEIIPDVANDAFGFRYIGNAADWMCIVQTYETPRQVIVYSICPLEIPVEWRVPSNEFITRANFGMILGNFEMDLDDGEIRYKTSEQLGDQALTDERFKPLVLGNLAMMAKYLPGIAAVAQGAAPRDALLEIEVR